MTARPPRRSSPPAAPCQSAA